MEDSKVRSSHSKVVIAVLSLAFLGSASTAGGDQPDPSCKNLPYIEAAGAYGDAKASYQLAQMYFKGLCVRQNDDKGYQLVLIAAMRGYSRAQFVTAGLLNKAGKDSDALVWARRAAEQGDADGQDLSAFLYVSGKGVTHNFKEGAKWALRSAEQGNNAAQGLIADLYHQGVGVTQNPIEADKWLILNNRANSKSPSNATSLGLLATQTEWEKAMSAADVAEAHRRADAWKPKPEQQSQ